MKHNVARAAEMDFSDDLARFREHFRIPKGSDGLPVIYFCGNSLGLQPKETENAILQDLKDWEMLGVEGHTRARFPWMPAHEFVTDSLATLTGALASEVVAMNTLTTNLHLLMVSFYRPTAKRYKILIEKGAFPSDRYAVLSQLRFHGVSEADGLIEVSPKEGNGVIHWDDLAAAIQEAGEQLALILIGGVNYYSGQVFPMAEIVKAGHAVGAMVGFDLAHGIGNVELKLHDWQVDFAAWCSYKYLNSGPGGIAGIFVHEKHCADPEIPRFEGWWGTRKQTRFLMQPGFDPIPTAEAWQLSNPPVFCLSALRASLALFDQAGMESLLQKSRALHQFARQMLQPLAEAGLIEILTPAEPVTPGCQLSLRVKGGKAVFRALQEQNVICDWREPDVIRIAPVPLYNQFREIAVFTDLLESSILQES